MKEPGCENLFHRYPDDCSAILEVSCSRQEAEVSLPEEKTDDSMSPLLVILRVVTAKTGTELLYNDLTRQSRWDTFDL